MKPLPFSWKFEEVPHGLIDINRNCNISCVGCYNTHRNSRKSLRQLEIELDQMVQQRAIHTVSIVGGEPTLHPELFKIIELIKRRKLYVALVTNGLIIDENYAKELKRTGVNLIFLHIDARQTRSDISHNCSYKEIQNLQREKAEIVFSQGIEVGLQVIVYRSRLSEVESSIDFLIESPIIHYLFITNFTDLSKFGNVTGDLRSGFRAVRVEPANPLLSDEEVTIEEMQRLLRQRKMCPFIYLGSNLNPRRARWLIYKLAVLKKNNHKIIHHTLTSSLLERILIRLLRLIRGKHFYYHQSNALQFKMQILLNALTGGRLFRNLIIFLKSLNPKYTLYEKHILIQQGPTMTSDGVIEHCRNCPDATIKNGVLIPVCIVDKVNSPFYT